MDPVEAELIRQLELRRTELIARAEKLSRDVRASFAARKPIRRNPLGGVLGSALSGLAMGLLPSRRKGAAWEDPGGPGAYILSLAKGVLQEMGPAFLTTVLASLLRSSIPHMGRKSGPG